MTLTTLILAACLALTLWARTADASVRSDARKLRRLVHPCLAAIIDRENTTWNPRAWNHEGSGAYGLPQALPGSKMRSAGSDWRTNPITQLVWALSYVNGRYGGPCEALAFHRRNGWY